MTITQEVYALLGITQEDPSSPWPGGILQIKDIPYAAIKQIADILGEDFLQGGQNNSPTMQEFLETFEPHQEKTFFNGYIVSPRRSDERITIDAITTVKTDDNVTYLRHADEFDINDDVLYAWYD